MADMSWTESLESLPTERRIEDLLSRMIPEKKAAQLGSAMTSLPQEHSCFPSSYFLISVGMGSGISTMTREAYSSGSVRMRSHLGQGGALGYASREWTATPGNRTPVELPIAFGWNPPVKGAKSEDTVLTTGNSVEVLSSTGEFPTLTAEAVGTDFTLTLPNALSM